MKFAKTVLCDEKVPNISDMAALISQLNAHFGVKEGERTIIKDVKTVMSKDYATRYQKEDIQQLMSMASLLGQRFKTAPFLSPGHKMLVFTQIANKVAELCTDQVPRIRAKAERDPAFAPVLPQLPSPSEPETPNPRPVRTETRSDQEID